MSALFQTRGESAEFAKASSLSGTIPSVRTDMREMSCKIMAGVHRTGPVRVCDGLLC